jgi:hypothetical protein
VTALALAVVFLGNTPGVLLIVWLVTTLADRRANTHSDESAPKHRAETGTGQ